MMMKKKKKMMMMTMMMMMVMVMTMTTMSIGTFAPLHPSRGGDLENSRVANNGTHLLTLGPAVSKSSEKLQFSECNLSHQVWGV